VEEISSLEYAIDRNLSRFTWMPKKFIATPDAPQDWTALDHHARGAKQQWRLWFAIWRAGMLALATPQGNGPTAALLAMRQVLEWNMGPLLPSVRDLDHCTDKAQLQAGMATYAASLGHPPALPAEQLRVMVDFDPDCWGDSSPPLPPRPSKLPERPSQRWRETGELWLADMRRAIQQVSDAAVA
jgi:hypothetical protein